MSSVLAVGLLMIGGVAAGRVASGFGLSSVTGYLLAGLLIGQVWPGVMTAITDAGVELAAGIGLALIAFVVGGELETERLRSLPRGVVGMAMSQAIGCVLAVTGAAMLSGQPVGFGLMLGAIAAATAPSTTIMIVRKHKADGPFTNTLLSVVAMDDAVCIVLYAVTVAVAKALPDGMMSQFPAGVIGVVLWEIFGSAMVGVVLGIALGYFVKYARGGDELVVIVVGSVLLAAGLASRMHVSPLITCLVAGATVSNLVLGSRKLFATIDRFAPPIYVFLFCLAGVECRFSELFNGIGLFFSYAAARVLGKVIGAWLASWLSGADGRVRSFLGVSLLPQAGLAAALTVAAGVALPDYRSLFASFVVPGVLLFEAIGPAILVRSLRRSGEVKPEVNAS